MLASTVGKLPLVKKAKFMYTLEAILAQKATIRDAVEDFLNAKLIQLPQDIYMIPMVGTLLQELELRYQDGESRQSRLAAVL